MSWFDAGQCPLVQFILQRGLAVLQVCAVWWQCARIWHGTSYNKLSAPCLWNLSTPRLHLSACLMQARTLARSNLLKHCHKRNGPKSWVSYLLENKRFKLGHISLRNISLMQSVWDGATRHGLAWSKIKHALTYKPRWSDRGRFSRKYCSCYKKEIYPNRLLQLLEHLRC